MKKILPRFSLVLLLIVCTGLLILAALAFDLAGQVLQPDQKLQKKLIVEFEEINNQFDRQLDFPIEIAERDYDLIGPQAMLGILEGDQPCHRKSHSIGRIAYRRTKDVGEAIHICGKRCSGGCFHGVMRELYHVPLNEEFDGVSGIDAIHHLASGDLLALRGGLRAFCSNASITGQFEMTSSSPRYFHGVGHILAYIHGYDLPQTLDDCRVLFEEYGDSAVYYCASGAYMEHDDKFGDFHSNDTLFPCNSSLDHPSACYVLKLKRVFSMPRLPSEIASVCLNLSGAQRSGCFFGMGRAVGETDSLMPFGLANACNFGNSSDNQMCLWGESEILSKRPKYQRLFVCLTRDSRLGRMCRGSMDFELFGMESVDGFYHVEGRVPG